MEINPYVFFAGFGVFTTALLCLIVWHASALDDLDDANERVIDTLTEVANLEATVAAKSNELRAANTLLSHAVFTSDPQDRDATLYCLPAVEDRHVPDRPQDIDPLAAYADFGIVYSD